MARLYRTWPGFTAGLYRTEFIYYVLCFTFYVPATLFLSFILFMFYVKHRSRRYV